MDMKSLDLPQEGDEWQSIIRVGSNQLTLVQLKKLKSACETVKT